MQSWAAAWLNNLSYHRLWDAEYCTNIIASLSGIWPAQEPVVGMYVVRQVYWYRFHVSHQDVESVTDRVSVLALHVRTRLGAGPVKCSSNGTIMKGFFVLADNVCICFSWLKMCCLSITLIRLCESRVLASYFLPYMRAVLSRTVMQWQSIATKILV